MSLIANQTKKWVNKGSEFYSRSVKQWLQDNDIELYSTHNEGKFVVAERFIRTSKNKIYKHMTSISKNVYIDKLDDAVNKCNNTYHSTIKMKPVNVKSSKYIDINEELMILLEYQNVRTFLQKDILRIGRKKFLLLKKLKTLFYGHLILVNLTVKKLLELFTKRILKNKWKRV